MRGQGKSSIISPFLLSYVLEFYYRPKKSSPTTPLLLFLTSSCHPVTRPCSPQLYGPAHATLYNPQQPHCFQEIEVFQKQSFQISMTTTTIFQRINSIAFGYGHLQFPLAEGPLLVRYPGSPHDRQCTLAMIDFPFQD